MTTQQSNKRIVIPSGITLLNWFSGVLSIICVTKGYIEVAALLIVAAAIFDFFDGMVARLINAQSEIGVQLDSLADSVSFGLAPGFLIYHHLLQIFPTNEYLALLGFIPSAAAVARLAVFNVMQSKERDFTGLASPAFALFIIGWSLVFYMETDSLIFQLKNNAIFWITTSVVMAYLMLSPLKMFSFKFKHLKWKENEIRYIFLIISFLMFLFLQIIALPLVIVVYILLSVVYHIKNKNNN